MGDCRNEDLAAVFAARRVDIVGAGRDDLDDAAERLSVARHDREADEVTFEAFAFLEWQVLALHLQSGADQRLRLIAVAHVLERDAEPGAHGRRGLDAGAQWS